MYVTCTRINRRCRDISSMGWRLHTALAVLFSLASLQSHGVVLGKDAPRVALLFLSRGAMPLESGFVHLLEGVRGLQPPQLSASEREAIMEDREVSHLRKQMAAAGSLESNSLIVDAACVDNALIRVRFSYCGTARSCRVAGGTIPCVEA